MIEYLLLLGFWKEPIWGFTSPREVLAVMFSGLALIFIGYILKGVWGSVLAFGFGICIYLYLKGLLLF